MSYRIGIYRLVINILLLNPACLTAASETLCSLYEMADFFSVHLLLYELANVAMRWLKEHYLGCEIPWMRSCMVNWLFSVLWLIELGASHFNALCFSVPSHLLSLKGKSESLSWSPIKDLHCYIFHFNYRIQSRLWLILLFIRQHLGKKKIHQVNR